MFLFPYSFASFVMKYLVFFFAFDFVQKMLQLEVEELYVLDEQKHERHEKLLSW
jgi:hypothetical protein